MLSNFKPSQVAAVFDGKAPRWSEKAKWMVVVAGDDSPINALIEQHVKPGSLVVDVGCGDGKCIPRLLAHVQDGTVVMVDLSRQMARQAANRVSSHWGDRKNVLVVVADAQTIPLDSGSQDIILMRHLLQHIAAPASVLAEVARVLKPSGKLLLQVPGPGFLAQWYPFRSHAEDEMGRFSPGEIHTLLETAKLQVTVTSHLFMGEFPLGIIGAFNHLLEIGTLDRLLGYQHQALDGFRALLETELFDGIARRIGKIDARCEYLAAVGEKRL